MQHPNAQFPAETPVSGASCVSFVWLINERSSAAWAAEKMECLRFYSYVTIPLLSLSPSLLPRHPPSKRMNYGLRQIWEWKHVQSSAEIKMYSPELWKTHASHTVFLFCLCMCVCVCVCVWRTYVWLHQPCSNPSSAENCSLLVPPQILSFPICCVALEQIGPTQLRGC